MPTGMEQSYQFCGLCRLARIIANIVRNSNSISDSHHKSRLLFPIAPLCASKVQSIVFPVWPGVCTDRYKVGNILSGLVQDSETRPVYERALNILLEKYGTGLIELL